MISKSNKFIKYASIAALAIVTLAASLSSSNINLSKNILRSRASEEINGSITFSKPSSTTTNISNNYYFTSGKTTTGMTVYLRNVCTTSFGNSNVAVMPGLTESPSLDPEITFSLSNSAASVPHFEFQNITSIYARSDSATTRTLYVYTSNDGSSWSSAISFGINSSGATCTNVSGAKYLKLGYQGFYTVNIVEFVINYTCSSVEPEPSKTVESIEVKTAPKTDYTEGDYFDPTGLVITASYNDGSEDDIAYSDSPSDFTFSPSLSTALSTEDTSVTITYGDKSTSQLITVSEATYEYLDGTYALYSSGGYPMWRLSFQPNLTGTYKKYDSAGALQGTETFTYTLEDGVLVINDVTASYTSWTSYYLTSGSSATVRATTNDTGRVNEDTITITTYTTDSKNHYERTFTKMV